MFIVMEIQKTGDQIATLVNTYATRNEADSKFHTVLAAAAISNVPLHACVMMTETGAPLRYENYVHTV